MLSPLGLTTLVALVATCKEAFGSQVVPLQARSEKRSPIRLDQRDHSLQTRAPPSGWSLYVGAGNDGGGCYGDGNPRVLSGFANTISGSSIEKAVNECKNRGFQYAGVQYFNQVYCGNSLPSNLVSVPSSQCNTPCTSGEKCGGAWRLNIYTSVAAPPTTWRLQGCFQDGGDRALKGFGFYNGQMTVELCQSECLKRGFSLAGVEMGTECYCANSHNANKLPDSACGTRCSGGQSGCGGAWSLSIYSSSNASPSPSPSPSPSASPTPSPITVPSGWRYLNCINDGNPRALQGSSTWSGSMTSASCVNWCASKGYTLCGLQAGIECFGATKLSVTGAIGAQVAENQCGSDCAGGGGKCGGSWRMSLWTNLSGTALSSALGQTTTTAAPTTAPTTTRTTTTTTSTTPSPSPTAQQPSVPGSYTPPSNFPSNGGEKQIYAHFMMGNTYSHSRDTWRRDINEARSAGIDGFFLNLGRDSWQPARLADAYAMGQETGFKMVLSFDMEEISCGGTENAALLRNYLSTYINHPAAGKYRGKSILTTFSGHQCQFGTGSTNAGWASIMGSFRSSIWFVPAYNVDPMQLSSFDINAECNWGSAWPDVGKEIETSRDIWFMQQLGSKGYMGTVSPLFATHLSYKNWIWRGDNMLLANRWEQLLSMRDRIDQVQVLSWNDYGESIYLNTIGADLPAGSERYANNQFPHTALLSLQAFYSSAWKSGRYPAITKDQIWLMARPHPAGANINNAPIPAPRGRELTNDNMYTQVHLLAPATVYLCAGSSCVQRDGVAGINRFSYPLQVGQKASVRVQRGSTVAAAVEADAAFNGNPTTYNYNYWVKAN